MKEQKILNMKMLKSSNERFLPNIFDQNNDHIVCVVSKCEMRAKIIHFQKMTIMRKIKATLQGKLIKWKRLLFF